MRNVPPVLQDFWEGQKQLLQWAGGYTGEGVTGVVLVPGVAVGMIIDGVASRQWHRAAEGVTVLVAYALGTIYVGRHRRPPGPDASTPA